MGTVMSSAKEVIKVDLGLFDSFWEYRPRAGAKRHEALLGRHADRA
jgi:hypothetical protein